MRCLRGAHFPGDSVAKNLQSRRSRFDPWIRKIPWRWEWQPNPVFLPGKSHGQRSLEGYSPWSHKESDTTEHTHTHTHLLNVSVKFVTALLLFDVLAFWPHGMWDLSSPTRNQLSPFALKGEVLTTVPPGRSLCSF